MISSWWNKNACRKLTCAVLVGIAGYEMGQASAATVTYRLDVENTWSSLTHPGRFPAEAHFSWLGGGTHSERVSFWDEGGHASPGMVEMAETGVIDTLVREVDAAVREDNAGTSLAWRHWFCPSETQSRNCGPTSLEFEMDDQFPLVTLATMLGPSPDWYVGVSGLALREDGHWIHEVAIDLRPYDAGTRSANRWLLHGPENDPPDRMQLITNESGHLVGPDSLGTMTFTLIRPLQAGDADQDADFDQFDLIQVQVAAKFLTGQAATWGEGDWNGAPGGTAGSAPAGNGFFDQLDIIAALAGGKYLTGKYAALAGNGRQSDDQSSIIDNPATGELGVDAPAGVELTSISIDSAAAIFTGDYPENVGGSDCCSDENIFKATFGSSFGSLSFGNVAQTGLSNDFVLNDLTVVGSRAGGGDLGAVDLIYIPEPSSLLLALLGIVGLRYWRR